MKNTDRNDVNRRNYAERKAGQRTAQKFRRREQRNTQGRTGRAAMVLAAENRTIGSGENKKSGGEDKIAILSTVPAALP